ncbi:hypothetical protein GQ55_5G460100 [Panicum hallii var. hallii]|uniref:RING-type E3 ubiquitin transferase n=1 Tax=Panicum hallii var. hallii TaxID=1504633 RepID=A0A2T7DQH2_9POAL|nr:hypothetical protein GQ55_5G460100 [Panicum hallii var. hallii]
MEKRSGNMATAADSVATPKKARTALRRAPAPKEEPGHEAVAGEEPTTLDVTLLAPDALECPLCSAPFEAAIFQCNNGHAACRDCCDRVRGTCPSCRAPTGAIRCRPLERAIAAMLFPCAFSAAGCERRLRISEKRAHEAAFCQHAPCACPVPGCAYAGLSLHDHIRDAHQGNGDGDDGAAVGFVREAMVTLHRSMVFRVLLQMSDSRGFLLANSGNVPSGRSLSLLSLGPRPDGDGALEFTMVVRAGGETGGALSLSAFGPVPCARRWAGPEHLPAEGFLFVPDAYWSSSGSVSVTVHVGAEVGRGAAHGRSPRNR